MGPKQVKAKRDSQFSHYMRRAVSLAKSESALKAGLPGAARRILEPKRLLLFKEMCKDAGVADETLFDQMLNGFPLLGRGADSPEFPLQDRPPTMTPDQVRRASVWVRKAAFARSKPPEDLALAAAVWAKTKEELDQGWIQGPFSTGELQEWLGDYVVSRRFGIAQGEDVRVIANFFESMVNPAFCSPI